MKRIVAFTLAVIMTMTMFCALTVSSTAADVDLTYKVVCTEPDSNGVFDCKLVLVDSSAYGFIDCNFKLEWNPDEVTPVSQTIEGTDVCFDCSNAFTFADEVSALGIGLNNVTQNVSVGDKHFQNVSTSHPTYFQFFFNSTNYPFGWGEGWKNSVNTTLGKEAALTSANGNELTIGTVQFKLNEGVDTATITADNVKSLAQNFGAATAFNDKPERADAKVAAGSATVTRPTGPVELTVKPGASIRYVAPQGLRFTSSINVVDDTATVEEIGTYITREDSDKVLNIPAKKFTDDANTIFTAVIADISSSSYGKTYFAQAYAVVDGVTYTSEKSAGSNPHDVAVAALEDETWQSASYATQARNLLNAYAGK